MNKKEITYQDYDSLDGKSELDLTETLNLFRAMNWQDVKIVTENTDLTIILFLNFNLRAN